jgi:predicted phosphate transport protein (TIGR00153 family)
VAVGKDFALFRRTKALENEIDDFLNKFSEGALAFRIGVQVYIAQGRTAAFEEKLYHVNTLENTADNLRRSIEIKLYSQTLIPESRGDVLGLLETLDSVLNLMEGALWAFFIERPEIPEAFRADFVDLTDKAVQSVDALVQAARAFFRNIEAVPDHNHKVMFFEKEADKISTKLKLAIFDSDLPLPNKSHLRYFVENIDNVADQAEDVADRLAIYTIKRTI